MNWNQILEESIQYLREYLLIDTVNPPGNEIGGARFFKSIFDRESIPCQVYEPSPGRGNILAHLKGSGAKRPILLLNHMDVVPAEKAGWELDPFGGMIKEGYLYGRGTLDDKSMGIIEMMVLLLMKRADLPLQRDIFFLACADEETGGKWGIRWAMENIPILKEVELSLNEGGYIILDENGEPNRYEISSAQKDLCQLMVSAKGTSGHGSMPHNDNPNVKLVRALDSITRWETPHVILPMVKEFFSKLAPKQAPGEREFFEDLEKGLKDASFASRMASNPIYNAMLRDTVSLNVLQGGSKVNVIPSESTALIDCRLVPGSSKEAFLQEIKKRAGESVSVEVISEGGSCPISPWETDLVRAIKKAAAVNDPGCPVVPVLLTGATDSRTLRENGILAYDFCPFRITEKEYLTLHGANERIAIENLRFGSKLLMDVLKEISL